MPLLSIIPAAAVADDRLTDTQVRVLCAIGTFTNRLGGNVWASVATLAKACHLSPRTVQRAVPVLMEAGYLRRMERPGRTPIYEVVLESGATLASLGGDSPVIPPPTVQSPKRVQENDKLNELAHEVTKAVWRIFPKRDTPHLYPPALRAIQQCLKDGAAPEALVNAASVYGTECAKKQVEPRYVRTIARFYSDGAWEHCASEVRVHGRTRDEWARSGQDVAEFDHLAMEASR